MDVHLLSLAETNNKTDSMPRRDVKMDWIQPLYSTASCSIIYVAKLYVLLGCCSLLGCSK